MSNTFLERNSENLRRAVLAALAYFDVFKYPLTVLEISRYVFVNAIQEDAENLSEEGAALERIAALLHSDSELKRQVQQKQGFYFLKGREEIVVRRLKRYAAVQAKWQIARRAAKILRYIPFIKLAAVCNTLAFNNTRAGGDIDLFIITRAGRIWLARGVATVIITLAGLRRHGQNIANRICLSFFVADDALDLRSIENKPYDIYLYYWIRQLVPLYNRGQTFAKFQKANNWVKDFLPGSFAYKPGPRREIKANAWTKFWQRFGEILMAGAWGNLLENLARRWQKNIMSHKTASVAREPNTKVVISDKMLKFHEFKNDPKDVFRAQFEQRLKSLEGQEGLPGVIQKPERQKVEIL